MMEPVAHGLVRAISGSMGRCELLHLPRGEFDVAKAREQHGVYVDALEDAGVAVSLLPEEPGLPDSAFVEDTAILLDEVGVICRLSIPSRQPEAVLMGAELARVRLVRRIEAPGTLEGGDVLRAGRTLYAGISSRTNRDGIAQLERIVRPFDYRVVAVNVEGCLHLKTGVTALTERLLVANPAWIDLSPFGGFEVATVPLAEPWGANVLPVNGRILAAASAPRTADLIESRGLAVRRLDISEIQKAEAGLTCLSLLYS